MDNGLSDRTLPEHEIEAMVNLIRGDWGVEKAVQIEDGRSSIYRIRISNGTESQECVLKAAPGSDRSLGIDTEARLLSILNAHSGIPVPDVIGAVDEHDDVRTPYFLMEQMAGTSVSIADVGAITDDVLRSIAMESGRHLAQLHEISTVSEFGSVIAPRGTPLSGEEPNEDPSSLEVRNGYAEWTAWLTAQYDSDVDSLKNTQFSDLAAPIRGELRECVDAIDPSLSPVLGRLDQAFPNLLVDTASGTIRAALDWESVYAVPAAYDVATVERILPGASWMILPDVPDRRKLVAAALLEGYREQAPQPSALERHRRCCEWEHLVITMLSLENGRLGASIADGQKENAAADVRANVEDRLAAL